MKSVIAIVDDDKSVRDALASLMNSLGYEAVPYSSGDEFMESAERGRTACLIADVNMPGMTGPQLHQRLIRSGERIPTIFVTAYPDDGVRTSAAQAGADCYLTKPFHEDELLACVRSALKRST
ncbi:MAG: response regulator [Pseudomonadota bacterium]|nr:response regulator [Pseudomonadota bacterium]